MKTTSKRTDDEDEQCIGLVLSRKEFLALLGGYGRASDKDIASAANHLLHNLTKEEYFTPKTVNCYALYQRLKEALTQTY